MQLLSSEHKPTAQNDKKKQPDDTVWLFWIR